MLQKYLKLIEYSTGLLRTWRKVSFESPFWRNLQIFFFGIYKNTPIICDGDGDGDEVHHSIFRSLSRYLVISVYAE